MNRLRRRSLADQAGRLTVLGLLVAVLTMVAVGAPRLSEGMLDSSLRDTVTVSSPSARDLIASVEADHETGPYVTSGFTVEPTWNAMPDALATTRASMPSALREATTPGRYAGVAGPAGSEGTAGMPGFGLGPAKGSPGGIEVMQLEAYPQLQKDATLVSGHWPRAWVAGTPIPTVLTVATAKRLGWRVGESRSLSINGDCGASRHTVGYCVLQLVGTIEPKQTDSGFWQLKPIRTKTEFTYNSGGNPVYGSVGWVAAAGWTTLAPRIGGVDVTAWYNVDGSRVSLAGLQALQDGLTSFLANPRVVEDGTDDAHVLQFASLLPNILQSFQATRQSSAAIMALAAVAALGVGLLVLLTTVSLLVRTRRPVRELMRVRGATVAGLAAGSAGELAWAVLPGAVVGAAAGILLAVRPPGSTPVGVREVVTLLVCVLAPIVAAALFVLIGEGLSDGVRAATARQRWIGEVFLVVLAAAAFVTVTGEAASEAQASGNPDPLSVALVLLAGLAGAVIVLRGYPLLLRGVGRMLRGRGRAAAFVGVLEATRSSGVAWLVTAALTATAAGVLIMVMETSVGTAATHAGGGTGPAVLVPGLVAYVVAGIVLCSLFSAAAFAVSSVAGTVARRRRGGILHVLGFSRSQSTRVSAWGVVPAVVISVAVGVAIGLLCGMPVVGAFPPLPVSSGPGSSGGTMTISMAVSWPLVWVVGCGILVLALAVCFIAIGADSRAIARESRRSS
ncbi:hypothetical protein [Humibacter ginsenosidimutans]|uniref:ABC3 transporter permease C-terminal domain-containing protein n=1 Tax=Humibacter ginsenosidimutans TaxID=2599293 RepID=A0A5B8M368_9MICO|nr:hypothetical protein [Humibacter ginsenosidimutans]QDZ14726.1 hypothetical protein FPZ11_08125 [Humibacter ginsenosidimutans]